MPAKTKQPESDEEAAAQIRGEAEENKLDETVSGGRYKVGDQIVDAEGEPIKK